MNTATGQERSPAQRRRRPLSLALHSAAGSTAVLLALYVATQGRPNLSDLISANRLLDLGGRDPPSSAQICRRIAFVRVGCEVKPDVRPHGPRWLSRLRVGVTAGLIELACARVDDPWHGLTGTSRSADRHDAPNDVRPNPAPNPRMGSMPG